MLQDSTNYAVYASEPVIEKGYASWPDEQRLVVKKWKTKSFQSRTRWTLTKAAIKFKENEVNQQIKD